MVMTYTKHITFVAFDIDGTDLVRENPTRLLLCGYPPLLTLLISVQQNIGSMTFAHMAQAQTVW
jgi:hypothetical protein